MLFIAIGALLLPALVSAERSDISVRFSSDQYTVTTYIDTDADAYGFYDTNYNSSGWGYLDAHMQVYYELFVISIWIP